jgi:hypothetical protein
MNMMNSRVKFCKSHEAGLGELSSDGQLCLWWDIRVECINKIVSQLSTRYPVNSHEIPGLLSELSVFLINVFPMLLSNVFTKLSKTQSTSERDKKFHVSDLWRKSMRKIKSFSFVQELK